MEEEGRFGHMWFPIDLVPGDVGREFRKHFGEPDSGFGPHLGVGDAWVGGLGGAWGREEVGEYLGTHLLSLAGDAGGEGKGGEVHVDFEDGEVVVEVHWGGGGV